MKIGIGKFSFGKFCEVKIWGMKNWELKNSGNLKKKICFLGLLSISGKDYGPHHVKVKQKEAHLLEVENHQ
jgi:hypothetical protein